MANMNDPKNPSTPAASNPAPSKTESLAVWSMILGILSLPCFSIFTAIPGVICGHIALTRIKKSGGTLSGNGLATTGLVTGYMAIAIIPLIGLLSAIAIPNFVKARSMAQHNACINNLRQIDGAKQTWALETKASPTAVPTLKDIQPYLGRDSSGTAPTCPEDPANSFATSYSINDMQTAPSCLIHPGKPGDPTGHHLD
jgi:hypothetical protein